MKAALESPETRPFVSETPHAHASARLAPPFESIRDDLAFVEALLLQEARSPVDSAEAICRFVHEAGGKRLRPALAILSCRALGSGSEEACYAGAAVEMIHAATLLHDDIVDDAASRRGRPTVSARWGDRPAVLAGNLLFSRAFGLLARRGKMDELSVLSGCMLTMCEGELLQNLHRGDLEMTGEVYYRIIRAKTADFLSACCRIGAMLSGADPARVERLAEFGLSLGLAFQIIDDLLDVCGEERKIGKPLGGDLREGKLTLPLILGLQRATPSERAQITAIARQDIITPEAFEELQALLFSYEIPQRTREVAEDWTRSALQSVEPLPPSSAKDALLALANGLTVRTQ